MPGDRTARFVVDRGLATTAAALIGRIGARWRLLGSTASPAAIEAEVVCGHLLARVRAADPDLATQLGLPDDATRIPRIEATGHRPRRLAVVTATARGQAALAPLVDRSGWTRTGATIESHDPREMTGLLLDPDVDAILAAADRRPGADERNGLSDLGALIAAVSLRRPRLPIVLAGSMADQEVRIRAADPHRQDLLLGPDAAAGTPPGEPLREILVSIGRRDGDARWGLAAATGILAEVLDRRVELLDVGSGGGLRAAADPPAAGSVDGTAAVVMAVGALVPSPLDTGTIDGISAWSVANVDRHRLTDRLRELGTHPWGDAAGDGARLRMAAARAALARMVELTPDHSMRPTPDLVVVAGGAWAVAPGPAIALAVADVLRRPATIQLAFDHARLLGPIGAMADRTEALALIADLAEDLLAPLGGLVIPAGLRAGRSAGAVVVHGSDQPSRLELVPGTIELVDLPPGVAGTAEFDFRDAVVLGSRGRRFSVEVGGGLGGLLVDLRDIPLRLPDRHDRRRELLGRWQDATWPGGDP